MRSGQGPGLEIPETLHFQALDDWEHNREIKQLFPGPAGCLHGKRLECFWDLENAPLCDSWPAGRQAGLDLTASQHYDLLYNVLAVWHGVKYKDFCLHVYLSDTSAATLPYQVFMDINRLYGKNLDVQRPVGKTSKLSDGRVVRNKEDPFGVDARMKMQMEAYAERASPGDVLVIITGDLDFDEGVRKARQQHGLQIVHLSSKDKHNPKWSQMLRTGIISWHCWFDEFLFQHKDNPAIRLSPANQSKQLIGKAKRKKEVQNTLGPLGIVMLIDATNSMEKAIGTVKEQIGKLISELMIREMNFAENMQFAVVGYRDIGDERQFEILGHVDTVPKHEQTHFTSDAETVREFLGKLEAYGGRDYPEDVAGALLQVSELNFDRERLNMIFHIFNDPGHGRDFNDTYSDDEYLDHPPPPPREDPVAEVKRALITLKQECNVVKYHMLTINDPCKVRPSTTKTVEKIKELADGIELKSSINLEQTGLSGMHQSWIEECPVGLDCAKLMEIVVMAISRALSNATAMTLVSDRVHGWEESEKPRKGTIFLHLEDPELLQGVACTVEMDDLKAASQGGKLSLTQMSSRMKVKPPAYQRWYHEAGFPALKRLEDKFKAAPVQTVVYEMLEAPNSMGELLERIDNGAKLDVLFEAKSTRKYKIIDDVLAVGQERVCVLAMDRAEGSQLQVLKHFRHDGLDAQSHFRYLSLLTSHTLASFLARQFNAELDECEIKGDRIDYVDACVISYQLPNTKVRYRFQEKFMAGGFMKYTSNTGWIDKNARPVCTAFPHWVYCATEGRLMVSDIQGWYDAQGQRVVLTDPCLLCRSIGLMEDKDKDQGLQGMKDFFITHECDNICQELGLHKKSPSMQALEEIQKSIEELGPKRCD